MNNRNANRNVVTKPLDIKSYMAVAALGYLLLATSGCGGKSDSQRSDSAENSASVQTSSQSQNESGMGTSPTTLDAFVASGAGVNAAIPTGWGWTRAETAIDFALLEHPEDLQVRVEAPQTADSANTWFEHYVATVETKYAQVNWTESQGDDVSYYLRSGMAYNEDQTDPAGLIIGACKTSAAAWVPFEAVFDIERAAETGAALTDTALETLLDWFCALPLTPGSLDQINQLRRVNVSSADIVAVFYKREVASAPSFGWEEDSWILFANGLARGWIPSDSPAEMDLVWDVSMRPSMWRRWRMQDGIYEIEASDGWRELDPDGSFSTCHAMEPGSRLQRTYERMDVSIGYISTSTSEMHVSFGADGQFSINSGGLNSLQMGYGDYGSQVISTHQDGDVTVGSISNGVTVSSVEMSDVDPDRTGRYQINEWTLDLAFNNGIEDSYFFCQMNDGDIYFRGTMIYPAAE